jgi:propanol-preferring alcohol dehydrogenase
VFWLHAVGRTRVQYQIRKLEDINPAIEDVLAGLVTARLVFQF